MSKLSTRLAAVREDVAVRWTDERARRVERSLLRRQRRRAIVRTASLSAAILVLLFASPAVLHFVGLFKDSASTVALSSLSDMPPRRAAELDPGAALRLRDGSLVRLLDTASRVSELPAQAEGSRQILALEVQRGGARFQVVRNPARLFRVHAGHVIAEVLGTDFTMEQLGERVRVSVEHGRVRVLWPGGRTELGAGESGTFPPPQEAALADAPPPLPIATIGTAQLPTTRSLRGEPPLRTASPKSEVPIEAAIANDWQALAQEGHFESAYEALLQKGMHAVRGPAALLLAADVARLSRHPAAAVTPLRRVLREHPHDPRAPLAAFTLGRALLDELGQPRESAEAFRAVQDLDPEGPLSADALTREVEAWSRAGEPLRAHERALLYLRRYPDGDRLRSVRRYGGID